jgi:hypothetical protein
LDCEFFFVVFVVYQPLFLQHPADFEEEEEEEEVVLCAGLM